jgi:hypothetical protein
MIPFVLFTGVEFLERIMPLLLVDKVLPQRNVRRARWEASGDNGDFDDHIS